MVQRRGCQLLVGPQVTRLSEVEPCEDGARPVTGSLFIGPRSLFSIGAKPKESSFFFGGQGGTYLLGICPFLDRLASRRWFIPFHVQCLIKALYFKCILMVSLHNEHA